jgi:hypothetical protein
MAIVPKTTLTPAEKVTAAYLHLVRGVEVQDIGIAFGVNFGRVSEAISTIKLVVGWPDTQDARDRPGGLAF